ncbi:tropomyosin-like [Nicotiana sylvestris]|uniref:tropomyosin-like n=1 Tax=Nicotiana sylvestris TaxID=4096 RepID=UPI00388C4343
MNKVQSMADGWKSKMDRVSSEKEITQAKLTSVEVQLWVAKEEADKRSQLNNELRAELSSERDALGKEYEAIKSKLDTTSADVEEMVAQYKADVEAAEACLKTNAEYIRRLSRRETLKEIHARGFDLLSEIEEAKKLEVEAKKLSETEGAEDSEGSEESEGSNDSGAESGPDEDQA